MFFRHAGFPGFSGGYVGVMCSSSSAVTWITSLLLADCGAVAVFDSALLRTRRARCILPALLARLFVCIPVAWLVMVPDALVEFGHSVVAVVAFVSNVLFWSENSYWRCRGGETAAAYLEPGREDSTTCCSRSSSYYSSATCVATSLRCCC
ncbi:MAG: hypothetical protein R3E84_02975 [Pseudomonadales bacterium]